MMLIGCVRIAPVTIFPLNWNRSHLQFTVSASPQPNVIDRRRQFQQVISARFLFNDPLRERDVAAYAIPLLSPPLNTCSSGISRWSKSTSPS